MDRDKPLNVHEAKAHFSELLDRAHAGQEFVVSKNGKPWAKIVPIGKTKKRELGFGVGTVGEAFFDPLPDSELDAWDSGFDAARVPAKRSVVSASRKRKTGT